MIVFPKELTGLLWQEIERQTLLLLCIITLSAQEAYPDWDIWDIAYGEQTTVVVSTFSNQTNGLDDLHGLPMGIN